MRTAREIPACTLNSGRTPHHVQNNRKAPVGTTGTAAISQIPPQTSRSGQTWQGAVDEDASRALSDHGNGSKQILKAADLHFKIWHRFRAPGTECAKGEEVAACSLVSNQSEFYLPLSLALRLVFDFLARHRHVPLGAAQIAASFKADPFYREHGCNAMKGGSLIRLVSISSVRVYIERIRRALTLAFGEANLLIDPCHVLVSQETVTNEVGYRLRGTFEWMHTDHRGQEFEYLR